MCSWCNGLKQILTYFATHVRLVLRQKWNAHNSNVNAVKCFCRTARNDAALLLQLLLLLLLLMMIMMMMGRYITYYNMHTIWRDWPGWTTREKLVHVCPWRFSAQQMYWPESLTLTILIFSTYLRNSSLQQTAYMNMHAVVSLRKHKKIW